MQTATPEKILKIVADIASEGSASLTRLTVLKKWFERPGRLSMFALWVARQAAERKGKRKDPVGVLLDEARALLGPDSIPKSQPINRRAAKALHDRARDFQNEHQNRGWNRVRIIRSWPLLLVEQGLAIHLGQAASPSHGYRLAADWAQNYDSRYGSGLNGPSRGKLQELVRFMVTVEALEDER